MSEYQNESPTDEPIDHQPEDPKPGGAEGQTETGTIPDDALPDDLVPGKDNPLAEGLPPGETAEGLLESNDEEQAGQD